MCGIAGIWGTGNEAAVRTMMQRLLHRGPDASGLYASPVGTLGHRRLSIMDVTGGDQPIYSADRRRAIIANGEIYNYPALRQRLGQRHTFHTRNDTEAALHLYEDIGQDVAEQLDGMFALAITDGGDLYVARDPIGIKPLYYGSARGAMVFASELKALVGMAEDVKEFPPGASFHSRRGFRSFYRVPHRDPEVLPLGEYCHRLRVTVEQCVVKRLMSDVPVGAFLSGGLDSSLIVAIARQHIPNFHTFSVGIEGSRDLAAARRAAGALGTLHHEYILTHDEILAKLPEVIFFLESYDQDLVRSAIPCYFTSRLAAEHVKVVLTGEGADELFAGYTYYRGIGDQRTLGDELRRSVASLHNVNLQRLDRLTMAHSLEGRVPFLDVTMIDLAQRIPAELKLRRQGDGREVEKWILRKACEDLLPGEILWRRKEQFDEGSGTADALATGLERYVSAADADRYARAHPEAGLRSHEECVYHKLLYEAFNGSEVVMGNVGRWSYGRLSRPQTQQREN